MQQSQCWRTNSPRSNTYTVQSCPQSSTHQIKSLNFRERKPFRSESEALCFVSSCCFHSKPEPGSCYWPFLLKTFLWISRSSILLLCVDVFYYHRVLWFANNQSFVHYWELKKIFKGWNIYPNMFPLLLLHWEIRFSIYEMSHSQVYLAPPAK